ncbi:MAG: hypothetical protein ACHP7I_03275 [Terriglobales bacterium]
MTKAPEFKDRDIKTLRQRAGEMCSHCKKTTSQSHSALDKSVTLGEAAHIRAARRGEARYVDEMTDAERGHIGNGIWLCRPCHKTIDSDDSLYTIERVQALKDRHEAWILDGKPGLENARKKSRILEYQGQTVGQLNGSRQWNPSTAFVVDCNDDNVILRFGNAEQQPLSWPLTEVTLETDVSGRFTIVLRGHGR